MIFDSNIVPIYSNISNQPDHRVNTILFISFIAFFLFINYILIKYSKKYFMQSNDTSVKPNKIFFWSIVVTQFLSVRNACFNCNTVAMYSRRIIFQ